MGRILTVCATVGSLATGIAWLVALVYMVEWYKLPSDSCQLSTAAPDIDRTFDPLSHILSLQAFSIVSLTVTAFVFTVFFLQLFYHERLAHEVLLEELADAAATTHFHSLLSSLCSSFTHTLLLLFNILITLTLILLCFLGLSAVQDTPQASSSSQQQQWGRGVLQAAATWASTSSCWTSSAPACSLCRPAGAVSVDAGRTTTQCQPTAGRAVE